MSNKLTLLRHGRTTSNASGKVSGARDNPPLTSAGFDQAERAGQVLRGSVNHVISSPKDRCIATARIAFGVFSIPPEHIMPLFDERRYGRFDSGPNQAWKDYLASMQPPFDELSADEQRHFDFGPDIENEYQLIVRSLGAVAEASSMFDDGESIGVATSGGILRGVLLGSGYDIPTGAVDNCARIELVYDGTAHIVSMAGVHLSG